VLRADEEYSRDCRSFYVLPANVSDNPQVPAALAQRALAYEQGKNYNAALSDLNVIITKYLGAREREAALQMKALILGQQENAKGMVDTFRQL